jgi:hypothetical protein
MKKNAVGGSDDNGCSSRQCCIGVDHHLSSEDQRTAKRP